MAQLALPRPSIAYTPALAEQAAASAPTGSIKVRWTLVIQTQAISYQCQQILKRLFDLTTASLGLLAISPLLAAIALLIKLDSPGPVLYKSTRIGRGFKPFTMYKFRTMVTDADTMRDALREKAGLQGELFKLSDDPRVTKLGQLLRKTSLDELPQLFNVVKGDMSLVGPRPLPPDESALFEDPYTARYMVIPGITGKWQVNGRSNSSFQALCQLELDYVNSWSLLEDVAILLQTIPVVLLRRGAC